MIGLAVGFVIAVAGIVFGLRCLATFPKSKNAGGGIGLCFAYIVALVAVLVRDRLQILHWSTSAL